MTYNSKGGIDFTKFLRRCGLNKRRGDDESPNHIKYVFIVKL